MKYILSGYKGDVACQVCEYLSAKGSDCEPFRVNQSIPQADWYLHLAARHPVDNASSLINSNLFFLEQCLNQVRNNVGGVVFFSSSSVYGNRSDGPD